jgi:hypothetical protein
MKDPQIRLNVHTHTRHPFSPFPLMSIHPPCPGWQTTQGYLPHWTHSITTVEKKNLEDYRCLVPNFINDWTQWDEVPLRTLNVFQDWKKKVYKKRKCIYFLFVYFFCKKKLPGPCPEAPDLATRPHHCVDPQKPGYTWENSRSWPLERLRVWLWRVATLEQDLRGFFWSEDEETTVLSQWLRYKDSNIDATVQNNRWKDASVSPYKQLRENTEGGWRRLTSDPQTPFSWSTPPCVPWYP